MADREAILDAAKRLVAERQPGVSHDIELRLFAIVDDIESERVVFVFRGDVAIEGAACSAIAPGQWVSQLVAELAREIEQGQYHLYTGTVRGGQLELVRESSQLRTADTCAGAL